MSDEEKPLELIDEDEERTSADECLAELYDVFSKYNLRVSELLIVYGNLGYGLGAGIEGYEGDQGPGIEELQKEYYSNPRVGIALMLQGMLTTSWHEQLGQQNNNGEKE